MEGTAAEQKKERCTLQTGPLSSNLGWSFCCANLARLQTAVSQSVKYELRGSCEGIL